ncbi:radical SAM protein [Acidobacteriota bacterium]
MTSPQPHEPGYIQAYKTGLLEEQINKSTHMLEKCTICPRECGTNRLKEEKGFCRAGYLPKVSSFSPHFGEERPLVGHHGSGTIFLTHCNLGCVFCQNHSISHLDQGDEIDFAHLSRMMVSLQALGCHNINFVSPTHFVPQILKALPEAIEQGLSVPLVYNTGGYDFVKTLELLDGIVDIYMPDFKYADSQIAGKYSQATDYPEKAKLAIKEMHRQVGDLALDDRQIAIKGLLIRHLVLPSGLAGTRDIMHFLASEISTKTYVNIMAQYYPCGDISPDSPLFRRLTQVEYDQAVEMAKVEGITRLD